MPRFGLLVRRHPCLRLLSAPTAPSRSPAPTAPSYPRAFDNWAAHQNWALAPIPFRHPWVFYLDADESCHPRSSRQPLTRRPEARQQRRLPHPAPRLPRRHLAPPRPDLALLIRLFRPEKMRYERLVNPLSIPDGPVGQLPGYLDHFPQQGHRPLAGPPQSIQFPRSPSDRRRSA